VPLLLHLQWHIAEILLFYLEQHHTKGNLWLIDEEMKVIAIIIIDLEIIDHVYTRRGEIFQQFVS
jgi:hypothetical protein